MTDETSTKIAYVLDGMLPTARGTIGHIVQIGLAQMGAMVDVDQQVRARLADMVAKGLIIDDFPTMGPPPKQHNREFIEEFTRRPQRNAMMRDRTTRQSKKHLMKGLRP
jgi:hypothetical protein